jgi:outer membrane protein assembly factor BamD
VARRFGFGLAPDGVTDHGRMVYCANVPQPAADLGGRHGNQAPFGGQIVVTSLAAQLRSLMSALALAVVLSACAGDEEIAYQEQSVYEIYSQAMTYLDDGRYKDAAAYFDEVERQHPYSVWATKSKLMSAYSHYQNNKYDDAISGLDRFIAVHPGNRDIAYAYYLKALCYYEQITDVQRDQDMTRKSLDALQDVLTRFPSTSYARDSRLKIDLTRDHLAGKEMTVGRFYLNRKQYLAAVNRFKTVVDQFGNTTHVPEALYRLTEVYTLLGIPAEAQKTAAVLGYNYPGTDWYEDAYELVQGRPQKSLQQQANSDKPWYQLW